MGVVGIDLGTTNTVVACVRNGRVHVIADANGDRLLPSVVSFHPNGEVLVGKMAKQRRAVDGKNTISSVKRLIGRSWQSEEIAKARQRFAFELREGPGQGPLVVARNQEYTLSEISAFILKRAKQIAEAAMGETVDRAVITVPAHFNELQRSSTKVAGRVAGMEVLRILNEPTAAALAYGLGRGNAERIAVYDFGGGTFDCTLIDLNGNVFEVLATAGDTFLGGDDIDSIIAERMADAFLMQHRYDARADPQVFERLRLAAEDVKIALSTEEHTTVRLREVAYGVGGAQLDLAFGMTRGELDALIEPFVERSFRVTQDALSLARMTPTSFDKVVLVGGSTRIPLVRRRVEQFFGAPPMDHVNPDEVVAIGAAIQAAALADTSRRRSIPPPPGSQATMPRDSTVTSELRSSAMSSHTDVKTDSTLRAQTSVAPMSSKSILSTVNRPMVPTQRGMPQKAVTQPLRAIEVRGPVSQSSAPPPPLPFSESSPSGAFTFDPSSAARTTRDGEEDEVTNARDLNLSRPSPSKPSPPRVPQPQAATPSKGFRAFGAIEDVPSMVGARPSTQPEAPLANTAQSPLGRTQPMAAAKLPTPPMTSTRPMPQRPMAPLAPQPPEDAPPASLDVDFDQSAAYAAPTPIEINSVSHPPSTSLQNTALSRGVSLPPSARGPGGIVRSPVLVDVTPRALVVETVGGFCDQIIPRNAKIPCDRLRKYSTGRDLQSVVRVRVAQGEQTHFLQNTFLGEVELTGIRPAPRGEVTIAVTFELDANGSLRVRATDSATGQEALATLQLIGIADESSVVMMIDRMAAMPVSSGEQQ